MWDRFKNWTSRPFSADMDAAHWFYFVGLLIVIGGAWGMILRVAQGKA